MANTTGIILMVLGIVLVLTALYVAIKALVIPIVGFEAILLANDQAIGGLGMAMLIIGFILNGKSSGYGIRG